MLPSLSYLTFSSGIFLHNMTRPRLKSKVAPSRRWLVPGHHSWLDLDISSVKRRSLSWLHSEIYKIWGYIWRRDPMFFRLNPVLTEKCMGKWGWHGGLKLPTITMRTCLESSPTHENHEPAACFPTIANPCWLPVPPESLIGTSPHHSMRHSDAKAIRLWLLSKRLLPLGATERNAILRETRAAVPSSTFQIWSTAKANLQGYGRGCKPHQPDLLAYFSRHTHTHTQ